MIEFWCRFGSQVVESKLLGGGNGNTDEALYFRLPVTGLHHFSVAISYSFQTFQTVQPEV